MDNPSTFLELPLDRDLYKPKKIATCEKPPLRILITEAGSKAARHLMYKICSGEVFGPDQKVILHLVNAKGCVNHRATLLDLEECGFHALEDSVVSAEPEKSYKNVDIVILIALFEELSGHNMYNSFLCQLNKTRHVARNMATFAKPSAKLIVSSPSTKGVVVLLTCLKALEPDLNIQNVTGVMVLDETIAKALLAAQLRTTTDKIKNVVIWGGTTPDLHNATVLMYPPDDTAKLKKLEIPAIKALENHKWIYCDLIPRIYRRVLGTELAVNGGAVASATAKHLKLLMGSSASQEEMVSMAVIVPSSEPYGIEKHIGFSFPVVTNNGEVTILQNVECATTTQLMNLRSMYNLSSDRSMQEVFKMIAYIKEYEEQTKKEFLWNQHTYLHDKGQYLSLHLKYIISPRHDESPTIDEKEVTSKKSITWEEGYEGQKSAHRDAKSVLRFNLQQRSSM